MRALAKLLLFITVSAVVTRVAALVVSKQLTEGTEVSDEFRRVVLLDGLDFTSRAGGLRSAEISVVLGGAKFDLRHAVIDPAGARLLIENTMGGLAVLVREDWAVTVRPTILGGGEVDVNVSTPGELADDAPVVEIDLITRLGGSIISSSADEV